MLVDFAIQAEQADGLTPEEAICQFCIKRFRPILITTMAALLDAVPMMIGTGVRSEIRQPLGYAIVGGLAWSQMLTPYTMPIAWLYLDRPQSRLFGHHSISRCRKTSIRRLRNEPACGGLPVRATDGCLSCHSNLVGSAQLPPILES
jgi:hypothetical protein